MQPCRRQWGEKRVTQPKKKWSDSDGQKVNREGKTVRRVGTEWVGGANAQNTLHQTKALLRAGCVSSPFMFLYFPLKDKTKRLREQRHIKVKENPREIKNQKRRSKRVCKSGSHLPDFATTAMLGSFARHIGMAGLLPGRRGLKPGCCGDATEMLSISAFCLDSPSLPLSHTKPQKATEQETVSIKKKERKKAKRMARASWFLKR